MDPEPTIDTSPPMQPASEPEKARRWRFNPRLLGTRLKKRTRWICRTLIIVPLALFSVVLALTRSPLVGYMVRRSVEPLLGCELSHAGAVISLDGRLIVEDLSLRAPGVPGTAGEFLFVKRAEAELDWSRLLAGEVNPTTLRLHRPQFRVAQDTATGNVNLSELKPRSSGSMSVQQPPRIDVINGSAEFGEFTRATTSSVDSYRVLKSLNVSGAVAPPDPQKPIYLVRLHEQIDTSVRSRDASGAPSSVGMVLDGKIDLDNSKAFMRLLNVSIGSWPPDSIPTYLREIWERLDIDGRISEARFSYDPVDGPEASIIVDGVSMSALVPAAPESGKQADHLTLTDVKGRIRLLRTKVVAELDAVIADQRIPSHVSLEYKGLAEDSAFRCVITTRKFRVEKDPDWLAFTPKAVKDNLAAFCGPTALIDGEVVLERAEPGPNGPADLQVSGKLDLSEGTAAFHRVPYPFKNMTGHVEFDQKKITLTRIDGRADSGATVHATGWIAPPDKSAEVSLHVVVRDIPLDQEFEDSLPESRKAAISFLFSREKLNELRTARLVSSLADKLDASERRATFMKDRDALAGADALARREPIDREIADCDAILAAPEFELGGVAQLDISVHSPLGSDAPWTYTVEVDLGKTGFLAKAFPWPVTSDATHITLTQDTAKLVAGKFAGLTGGEAVIDADVILETNGQPDLRPSVKLRAKGLPIDGLLMSALPKSLSEAPKDDPSAAPSLPASGSTSPLDLLRAVNLRGELNCDADISPAGADMLALAATLSFDDLRAGPFGSDSTRRFSMTEIGGRISVGSAAIETPVLRGKLVWDDAPAPDADQPDSRRDAGRFQLSANAVLAEPIRVSSSMDDNEAPAGSSQGLRFATASLAFEDFDASLDFETIVGMIAKGAGEPLAEVRRERQPAGRLDGVITAVVDRDAPGRFEADITSARSFQISTLGERVTVELKRGNGSYIAPIEPLSAPSSASDDAGGSGTITLHGVEGEFVFGSDAPVNLRADGTLDLSAASETDGLNVQLDNGAIDSCLVSQLLDSVAGSDTGASLDAADPHGVFDARLTLRAKADRSNPTGDGSGAMSISGSIQPRWVSFRTGEALVAAQTVFGTIEFDSSGVWTSGLAALGNGWIVVLQGGQSDLPNEGSLLDLGLWARADSLESGVRELLPETIKAKFDEAKLRVDGPIELSNVRVVRRDLDNGGSPATHIAGSLDFSGLSLDSAMPVRDGVGGCELTLDRPAGRQGEDVEWKFDAALRASHMIVSGLAVRNMQARMVSGRDPGEILIPSAHAECYEGRITGSGVIDGFPERSETNGVTRRGYRAEVSLAGVRFAPILEAAAAEEGALPPSGPVSDASRGAVDATLTFSGVFGVPETRAGLGTIRISGGDVVRMPLVMTLMQLSNFQFPAKDSFDYFQTSFRLAGETVDFDQIAMLSRTLAITGFGKMTWPGKELNLRFNSRSGDRVPLLSDVVEAVRNEVMTTHVGGTLMQPAISSEALPGARRMIDSTLGNSRVPARSVSEEAADRAARAERERLRTAAPVPKSSERD